MLYPTLREIPTQRVWTEQFSGLDRRARVYDGAFDAMGNMTGEPWPLLSSRKKRGLVKELDDPRGLCTLGRPAWVDGDTLYFDGEATPVTGLGAGEKRLVTMGAYILIFPDKVYYNTVKPEDRGGIEREWSSRGNVTFTICALDGMEYPTGDMTVGPEAPQAPQEGDYWLDTSGDVHALYRYFEGWEGIATVYVKISAPGIGQDIKAQDSVTVSGVRYGGENESLRGQLEALNSTHVVQAAGDDYIVVIGLLDQQYVQRTGAVRADRKIPELDFVIECNNRLWGCRYGEQDGETVNRIYACALGDFRSWGRFQGDAMDSFYVDVGTEGPFTGACVHRGNPVFFKSGCMHQIYGDKPGNFQSQMTICEGVKEGCGGTLTPDNGALYYVSAGGVQKLESLPENVGKALGEIQLISGTAGAAGGKYYLSAKEKNGAWSLYVMDMERGTWHRQDASRAIAFAELDGEMYMLRSDGTLWALNGTEGDEEPGDVTWYAETAPMGYEQPEHKYLSRFTLRMRLGADAVCRILAQYDGEDMWREKGTVSGNGKVSVFTVPIVPRRCDTMRLRLEGHGDFRLYGIARELGGGS